MVSGSSANDIEIPKIFTTVDAGLKVSEIWYANGTETSMCKNKTWTFAGADADIWLKYDTAGGMKTVDLSEKPQGSHYVTEQPDANGGQAVFKYLADDSTVTVSYQMTADGQINKDSIVPAVNSTKNIPYLVLSKTSSSEKGRFGVVEMMLRYKTEGGQPKSLTCQDGEMTTNVYKAEYWMLTKALTTTSTSPTASVNSGHKVLSSLATVLAACIFFI
jgi:hypothetical protein